MPILSLQVPGDSNYILCLQLDSQSPNYSKRTHDSSFLSITDALNDSIDDRNWLIVTKLVRNHITHKYRITYEKVVFSLLPL